MSRPILHLWIPIVLALPVAATGQDTASSRSWENREYGIGVVKYAAMYSYTAHDLIFAAPTSNADTVATFRQDSLCFSKPRACVRLAERMIEFDYEVSGWAILRFTPDSEWVKVTLAPSDPPGPVGWVRLRPDTAEALLWSKILRGRPLFFLRSSDIAFYSRPDRRTRINRPLVRESNSDRFNYIMNPLAARGRWLRVELLSPSNLCGEPKVTPDTVWIEYLTSEKRPNVFYYTRGC